MKESDAIKSERVRILTEYERRNSVNRDDIYAPWQPGEMLMISERKRIAASLLRKAGKFPSRGATCLEVGYGRMGWFPDLLSWGLAEEDLHGIEIDERRADHAQKALPVADLLVGDAVNTPWPDNHFDIAIVSTVFSSILNDEVRKLVADEIGRVLKTDGVVIFYDMRVGNPGNSQLKALSLRDIRGLFPNFDILSRSLTLAPPIARAVAGRSWTVAEVLSAVPFLRTHILALLIKR